MGMGWGVVSGMIMRGYNKLKRTGWFRAWLRVRPLHRGVVTALDLHEFLLHLEEVGEGEGQDDHDET